MAARNNLLIIEANTPTPTDILSVLDSIFDCLKEKRGLTERPLVYEYFHMIGSSHLGGIIAIMLGRLKMSTQKCREFFEIQRYQLTGSLVDLWNFCARPLFPRWGLTWIVNEFSGDGSKRFREEDTSCKVFLWAWLSQRKEPIHLTSYESSLEGNISILAAMEACLDTRVSTFQVPDVEVIKEATNHKPFDAVIIIKGQSTLENHLERDLADQNLFRFEIDRSRYNVETYLKLHETQSLVERAAEALGNTKR